MTTQAIGLMAGVPFIFIAGWTLSVPVLVLALAGFGYFKGLYDANIWASLHDVVPARLRATAVGVMNSAGWIGGGFAPIAIAMASERYGMSAAISVIILSPNCGSCQKNIICPLKRETWRSAPWRSSAAPRVKSTMCKDWSRLLPCTSSSPTCAGPRARLLIRS